MTFAQVRPESKTTVEALHRASIQVFMITGDNRMTAGLIASELGIPSQRVFAEVLPQDKADKVKQLQNAGVKVAMVGDGINDAPALAQADLGVAVASGTDIAAETANMVLLNSNPEDVVVALDVCRRAYGRIQLNLFISLVYNCLGIPFGFGLFYAATKPMTLPPAIAAVAMALSSVSVVLSALALNTYKRKTGREVQLTRVNLNAWIQSCTLGSNRWVRRRVEAEQLTPVVVATLEDPGDTSDSEEFTAMYCRMEDEGPMACDCPADVCTCASCQIHDIVTNTKARQKKNRGASSPPPAGTLAGKQPPQMSNVESCGSSPGLHIFCM
jgi:soluble P-type ATPase